ncbi:hypothetical protein Dimus_030094 [Dionaea muscipula]
METPPRELKRSPRDRSKILDFLSPSLVKPLPPLFFSCCRCLLPNIGPLNWLELLLLGLLDNANGLIDDYAWELDLVMLGFNLLLVSSQLHAGACMMDSSGLLHGMQAGCAVCGKRVGWLIHGLHGPRGFFMWRELQLLHVDCNNAASCWI